jgi:hypothetical protein
MYSFHTPNDQHNGKENTYGNVAGLQANYHSDGSHNADREVPNGSNNLLFQAYQQLHQAVLAREKVVTSYHELVVKNEAQVSALKGQIDTLMDQIDTLKDELRTAQADAETARLSSTL